MAATEPVTTARPAPPGWLLSAFLAAWLSLQPPEAGAENYSTAQTYLHSFSNNVSVYTGLFALNRDLSLDTSVYFKYTVDLINPSFVGGGEGGGELDKRRALSKSVAAVSGASTAAGSSGASDTRNDLTLGVSRRFGGVIGLDAYYDYSAEKDYSSSTPTLTLKKELFEKNTTLTAGYSRNMDRVDGKYMTRSASKNTDNYYLGVTQVLTPATLVQAGYSRNEVKGTLIEGNRLVPVNGADPAACTDLSPVCLTESFPDDRLREAFLFGVNRYLKNVPFGIGERAAVRLLFRSYRDDWKIDSTTEEVEYLHYLTGQDLLRLDIRNYDQTAAFFVKPAYAASDALRSATDSLEAQRTQLYGAAWAHRFPEFPTGDLFSDGAFKVGYEFYTQSLGVQAHNVILEFQFRF